MKKYCKYCKKTFNRDMRSKISKLFMSKRGYKSVCETVGKTVYLKPA